MLALTAKVNIATREDEPELLRLLHLMHAEGGLLSLDVDCAREMFGRAFDKKGGIIGVIGKPGKIEASIGLLISRFWYTRDNHIEEYFNFVDPEHRRSDHALTLIRFAKHCADEIKIPLAIGVMSNKRTAEKVRLYRRALGYPRGAFFVYGGAWPDEEAPDEEFWRSPFPRPSEKKNGRMQKVIERNG